MELEDIQPDDGYSCNLHRREVDGAGEATLLLDLAIEGHAKLSVDGSGVVIKTYEDGTRVDHGVQCRELLLARAVCRYLNTGGEWNDLTDLMKRIRLVAPGPLLLPDGLQLIRSTIDDSELVVEHIFANESTGMAVVWRENMEFHSSSVDAYDAAMADTDDEPLGLFNESEDDFDTEDDLDDDG